MLLAATLLGPAGLIALWGLAIHLFPTLPALIPEHFNSRGEPDRWCATTPMAWYRLPAIATGVIAMVIAAGWFCRWAAVRKPQLVNIPFKDRFLAASPERRAWIVEPIAAALAIDGVAVAGIFLYILHGTERVANGGWTTLSPAGFVILIPPLTLLPLVGTGWTCWRASQA